MSVCSKACLCVVRHAYVVTIWSVAPCLLVKNVPKPSKTGSLIPGLDMCSVCIQRRQLSCSLASPYYVPPTMAAWQPTQLSCC